MEPTLSVSQTIQVIGRVHRVNQTEIRPLNITMGLGY